MNEGIDVSLDRVRAVIAEISHPEFFTADVIRGYCGGFFSNTGTPVHFSLNAQFGKLLKRNEALLGIKETAANVGITDDRGHPTSSSKWVRNT